MIMAKPSDAMTLGYSPVARIQLVLVDVADSVRTLAQNHLSGPTAGLVLAESLAGVALLGADLTRPDETVTLRMRVSGPVEGVLVEVSQNGGLRGYTNVKVMNDLDEREELDTDEALGDRAEVQIIRSVPGRVLAHACLETQPASLRTAVEQFYAHSLQRRVAVQVTAVAYGSTLDVARGLMALALPDAEGAVFDRVAALFDDDTMAEELESCDTLADLGAVLGLDDLQFEAPRPLRFACRCSQERVTGMLAALSGSELAELVRAGKPSTTYCHMCGKNYEVSVAELKRLLEEHKS